MEGQNNSGSEFSSLFAELDKEVEFREEKPYVFEALESRKEGQETEPQANEAVTEQPVKTSADHQLTASQYVEFLSSALAIGGEFVYPRMLEPEDGAKIQELSRTIELCAPQAPDATLKIEIDREPSLADVVLRFKKYQRAVEGAPLTDTEKEMLVKPLAVVIEKYHWLQVGPEMVLLLVVIVVMTPRILPLFPGFTSLLSESMKKAVKL